MSNRSDTEQRFTASDEVVSVKLDGTVEVNREALHSSDGYKAQISALDQLSMLMKLRSSASE